MYFAVLLVVLLFLAYLYYRRSREGFAGVPFVTPLGERIELTGESKELIRGFKDPYYLNSEKLQCDMYPKSNGSIYKLTGDLLTGFPFYDKAY